VPEGCASRNDEAQRVPVAFWVCQVHRGSAGFVLRSSKLDTGMSEDLGQ